MEERCVVKTVYDFHTDLEGELSLQVGQIIQVTKRIDKHWLSGISDGKQGNFPSSFVLEMKIPMIEPGQKLFAATDKFIAQEDGDLSFSRGDIIIGKRPIDNNWWFGQCENREGIFPLTHVWALDVTNLKMEEGPKKVNLKARVKMDMIAQLPEEIDLKKGDIITVTELIDKDWYRGISSGKVGTFPAAFVTLLDETAATENNLSFSNVVTKLPVIQTDTGHLQVNGVHSSTSEEANSIDVNQFGYDNTNSGITPYGRTRSSFTAEYPNELSFGRGELVKLIRYVDDQWMEGEIDGRVGLFPSSYVNVIVDCADSNDTKSTLENIHSTKTQEYIFPVDTYGRILYDYEPQVYGDLRLTKGDTVTLVRALNSNWYEAMKDDGTVGLCPANFIEIIDSSSVTLQLSPSQTSQDSKISSLSDMIDWNESFNCENKPERPPPAYSTVVNTSNWFEDDTYRPRSQSVPQSVDNSTVFSLRNFDNSSTSARNKMLPQTNISESTDKTPNYWKNISDSSSTDVQRTRFKRSSTDLLSYSEAIHQTQPLAHSNQYNVAQEQSQIYMGEIEIDLTEHTSISQRPVQSSHSTPSIVVDSPSQLAPHRTAPVFPYSREISTNSSTDEGSKTNVEEMKKQLLEKENQLKRLEKYKTKMIEEMKYEQNENDKTTSVSSEIENQIAIYDDEIDGLAKDIKLLQYDMQRLMFKVKTELLTNKNEEEEKAKRQEVVERKRKEELERQAVERRKKMKEQRQCVILELIQTEKDYLLDLRICNETFLREPEKGKSKGIDMITLFGNLDEVIDMSSRLLKRLEKTRQQSSEDHQILGDCFIDLSEDMKEIYGHYCRNHDDIHSLLDKYEENPLSAQYLKHGVEIMRRQTNCFDLRSVLIKPVQRILKYPLLLNELVKCTEDTHEDKNKLIKAVGLMTDVATAINEFKRRKDLVFKYRKDADTSLSTRISKLNLHSVRKKSSRFGIRISSTIGLTTVTRDEVFENAEQTFRSLEKTIKIFLKDVNSFSEQMQDYAMTALNVAEDIADFYQDRNSQQEVERLRTAHRTIVTQFWEDFKVSTEKYVSNPLKELLQTFNGPNNLIQKRYDKLLDYEACTSRLERNKEVVKQKALYDEQQLAKNTYEALNSQLLDDLPKLCSTAKEILSDCVIAFLQSRKIFLGRTARQMIELTELPLLMGNKADFLETFQIKHNLASSKLSEFSSEIHQLFAVNSSTIKTDSVSKKLSPNTHRLSLGSSPNTQQTASQRAYLKSRYTSECLYCVQESYAAADVLDISIQKDDIVRVIKQRDPMGNSHRWFVDNGSVQGFVPAKFLCKLDINKDVISSVPSSRKESAQFHQPFSLHQTQSGQENITVDYRKSYENLPDNLPVKTEPEKNLMDMSTDTSRYSNLPLNEFDPLASSNLTSTNGQDIEDMYTTHRYETIPENYSPSEETNNTASNDEYFYALYPFDGKGDHQLCLAQGQVVLVHHKSDLHGNTEWWYAEDRYGNRGFVPANYLTKYTRS